MPRQPYLIQNGDSWMFVQPDIAVSFYPELLQAIALMDTQLLVAERLLRKIIFVCGNGSIDALLSLAVILNRTGRAIEGNALVHKAHLICQEAIPARFDPDQDDIFWCILENRPFLRAYHAVITAYMREQQYDKALQKINWLLKVNKGDDTNAAELLPACYIHMEMYGTYLEWYQQQPPVKRSMDAAFFAVLALFKLNRPEQARARFLEAKQLYPHMAAELLKYSHRFPVNEYPATANNIQPGSRQEAFVCWLANKRLWQQEKGLRKFIRSIDSIISRKPGCEG